MQPDVKARGLGPIVGRGKRDAVGLDGAIDGGVIGVDLLVAFGSRAIGRLCNCLRALDAVIEHSEGVVMAFWLAIMSGNSSSMRPALA